MITFLAYDVVRRAINMNNQIKNEDNHFIKIKNRNEVEITGVKKINSLNDLEFNIDTVLKTLVVSGNNLEMKHLDVEKGILIIEGSINSLVYEKTVEKEKKGSFLGKLFK